MNKCKFCVKVKPFLRNRQTNPKGLLFSHPKHTFYIDKKSKHLQYLLSQGISKTTASTSYRYTWRGLSRLLSHSDYTQISICRDKIQSYPSESWFPSNSFNIEWPSMWSGIGRPAMSSSVGAMSIFSTMFDILNNTCQISTSDTNYSNCMHQNNDLTPSVGSITRLKENPKYMKAFLTQGHADFPMGVALL